MIFYRQAHFSVRFDGVLGVLADPRTISSCIYPVGLFRRCSRDLSAKVRLQIGLIDLVDAKIGHTPQVPDRMGRKRTEAARFSQNWLS